MQENPVRVSIRGLKPAQQKKMDQALTGKIFVNRTTYEFFQQKNSGKTPIYIELNGYIVLCDISEDFQDQELGLNKFQRQVFRIDMVSSINTYLFNPPIDKEHKLALLQIELECIQLNQDLVNSKFEIDDSQFITDFRNIQKQQFFRTGQIFVQYYNKCLFTLKITQAENTQLGVKEIQQLPFGMLVDETSIELKSKFNQVFSLKKANSTAKNIFVSNFKFEEMGIGGLDEQLANIFRRAFASRRFPPSVLKKYGINHVKGVLLYGPPGTGKTLIARKLSKALNSAVEPKIVNGPEIMSAYVGKSEENVRNLFADAKRDNDTLGEDSQLHIIIFDEMDAICKQRGREAGAGGSAKDGVVNQLLSMIDGVTSLNNILVIGMTNRKDLIDEAILRPGRFEVHVEISLPDEKGRQDILKIHTQSMYDNKVISEDVNLGSLAEQTKNYTGAEIESLVKSAASFAFNRVHNIMDFKNQDLEKKVIVEREDFQQALSDVKPAFGFDEEKFDMFLRNKIIDYGERYQKIQGLIQGSIQQTKSGRSTQLHSILLEGEVGTGKTALAAKAAIDCGFPFVQMITAENFVGLSEYGKINAIVKVFEDAYKSPLSCIVLDNIERLIEFIDMGPRFSNSLLQTLLVLIKKIPKDKNNRLLIIGTTNQYKILQELEITLCFNIIINVPPLKFNQELQPFFNDFNFPLGQDILQYQTSTIPVKQLVMILDMIAVQNEESKTNFTAQQFLDCYHDIKDQKSQF